MHQNIDTSRLLRGEYIGTDSKLYGKFALLLIRGNEECLPPFLKAKFDDVSTGFGYGWHEFLTSQFEIDWTFDGGL